MKCKVLVRPTGSYNGQEWPEVGETIDLPDTVAEGMVKSGNVEIVKAPAAKTAQSGGAEKRPAAPKNVESRKGKA